MTHVRPAVEAQGVRREGIRRVSVGRFKRLKVEVTPMARVGSPPPCRKHLTTGGVHEPYGRYGSGSTVHQKDGPDAVTWVNATCEQNTPKRTKSLAKPTNKYDTQT